MDLSCCIVCHKKYPERDKSEIPINQYGKMLKNEEKIVLKKFFNLLKRYTGVIEVEISSNFFEAIINCGTMGACEDCLKEIQSFCSLFYDMKSIELLLKCKIWKLKNIMYCAERVPLRMEFLKQAFSKMSSNGSESSRGNSDVDESFKKFLECKKKLIRNCSRKLLHSDPSLCLQKCQSNEDIEEPEPSGTPAASPLYETTMENPIDEESIQTTPHLVASSSSFKPFVTAPTLESSKNTEISSPSDLSRSSKGFPICNKDKLLPTSHIDIDNASCHSDVEKVILLNYLSTSISTNDRGQLKCEGESADDSYVDGFVCNSEDNQTRPSTPPPPNPEILPSPSLPSTTSFEIALKLAAAVKSEIISKTGNKDKIVILRPISIENEEGQSGIYPAGSQSTSLPSTSIDLSAPTVSPTPTIALTAEEISTRRSLRTVHRCESCKRTFSREENLKQHQTSSESCDVIGNPAEASDKCSDSDDSSDFMEDNQDISGIDNDEVDIKQPFTTTTDSTREDVPAASTTTQKVLETGKISIKRKAETLKGLIKKTRLDPKVEVESDKEEDESQPESNQSGLEARCTKIVCPDSKCKAFFRDFRKFLEHRAYHCKKRKSKTSKSKISDPDTDNDAAKSLIQPLSVSILKFENPAAMAKYIKKESESKFEVYARIEIPPEIFSCPVKDCRQIFCYKEDLESHSKLHGQYCCNFCDVVEDYAINLAKHELTHKENIKAKPEATKTCPRCHVSFRKNLYFQHFLNEHLQLEYMEQCCVICRRIAYYHDEKVGKAGNALQHFKTEHNLTGSNDQIYKCEEKNCFGYFRRFPALLKHYQAVHKHKDINKIKRKNLSCKDCKKGFTIRHHLRLHRLQFHVKPQDAIPCEIEGCPHKFETKEDLDWHITQKHAKSETRVTVMCPKCGKSFIGGQSGYLSHMNWHEKMEKLEGGLINPNAKKAICETCGKTCRDRATLTTHMLSHTGPDSWKFVCNVCSKKCMTKRKLEEHLRTHTGEKAFVCQVCGVRYAHRHNLRIHVNSKHGDVAQDRPRKFDKTNLTSRKGMKQKRKDDDIDEESECSSDSN